MDEPVGHRCYQDVLHEHEHCRAKAEYVTLLAHSAMPYYLCGRHMAEQRRDWPDSIIWISTTR